MGNKPNGMTWAADNGCYSNPKAYSDERYLTWLDRQPRADCLFATAPDVMGDAEATLERDVNIGRRLGRQRTTSTTNLIAQRQKRRIEDVMSNPVDIDGDAQGRAS